MSLPTKREFLSANIDPNTNKPFASPGRGRFSAAAEAFAAANAGKFSTDAPKPAAKPKAPKVAAAVGSTATPTNGAERAAAALARREAKAAAKVVAVKPAVSQQTADPITPLAMPKRSQKVGYAVERGTLIAYTTCAVKGGCGKAVNYCACASGPVAPHYLDASVAGKPLLLNKPVVLYDHAG